MLYIHIFYVVLFSRSYFVLKWKSQVTVWKSERLPGFQSGTDLRSNHTPKTEHKQLPTLEGFDFQPLKQATVQA